MFKKLQQLGKQTNLENDVKALVDAARIESINAAAGVVVLRDISVEEAAKVQAALPDVKVIATQHKALQKTGQKEIMLPQIKRIIAVGSGKGGVGKSTVALNLARQLQADGQKTGILDLDIYGPSLPTMLELEGYKAAEKDKQFQPVVQEGLTCMSLGFLIDPDKATIWRGPMVMGAVQQLLRDTNWPELDTLILDLPPGTGDAQLTLAQKVRVDGAVIVTTPHDLSLIDAQKGLKMFQKMNVPILGMVENMAYFMCDGCEKRHYVFGEGKVKGVCETLGVAYLGGVPLTKDNLLVANELENIAIKISATFSSY